MKTCYGFSEVGSDRPVLYIAGFGDVQGSYRQWKAGKEDPTIPDRAFSIQVYETLVAMGRRVVVLTQHADAKPQEDEFATFVPCDRPTGRGIGYHVSEIAFSRRAVSEYMKRHCEGLIVHRTLIHYWPLHPAVRAAPFSLLDLHNTLWPMSVEPGIKSRVICGLNRKTLQSFGMVSCVSPEIERQVQKVTKGAGLTSVHMPQYNPEYQNMAKAPSEQERTILFAGRVEKDKGVFDLLEAFTLLEPELRNTCRLSFLGDGPALMALTEAVQQSGLAARVNLHGRVGGHEVFRHMAAAAVLVCPTQRGFAEGLARTPIEAAIVGVPSIVTDVVPAREILGDAVISVRPGSPQALAEALNAFLSDSTRYEQAVRATQYATAACFDRSMSLEARLLKVVPSAAGAQSKKDDATQWN